MRKPATLADALDVVRKSRLVNEERLRAFLDGDVADGPNAVFHGMVRDGLLTPFQASQLGHGRWKGFEIGNYRILDRLGAGGMGQVFLAEHVALGMRVAIKVLNQHGASPLVMERFVREARAAAKLNHPNIIRVHDINPNHDPPFIVMEYADGVTLQAAVARSGPLAHGDAATIGRQMALGLDEAFRHGLVHRDIKPANVLVDRRGTARLLDLGIVRIEGESLTGEYEEKIILGTLEYLAPEQAINCSNVDIRADLDSLGATLYFLLTGQPPLPAGPMYQRLAQLQALDPPHLTHRCPSLPAALADVIHTLLAKSPSDRFATPLLAAEALTPFAIRHPSFPTQLFRHERATLSDTAGTPTPRSGIFLPGSDCLISPTVEQSVECAPPTEKDACRISGNTLHSLNAALDRLAPRPVPSTVVTVVCLIIMGLLALFGLIGIALYMSE